jgi:hypothetical protein
VSTHPAPSAKVYDLRPADLTRFVERQSHANAVPVAVVLDDFADCVVAINALSYLSDFSVRVSAFLFAIAGLTSARSCDQVELGDQELADLQNCSRKTVERQRKDYLNESRKCRFNLVEIVEGACVPLEGGGFQHEPSLYRYTIGDAVGRVVLEARSAEGWDNLDRKRQIEIIRRVAAEVYEEIADAPARRRKRKPARLVLAEVKTYQKTAKTYLARLRERAACLTAAERKRLREEPDEEPDGEPGKMREGWLALRAEMEAVRAKMDALYGTGPSQVDETAELRQPVRSSPVDEEPVAEMSPEDDAMWEGTKKRLSAPPIQSVEIALRPPEPVSRDLTYETDGEMTVEELEAEAVRAEACGERAPWDE